MFSITVFVVLRNLVFKAKLEKRELAAQGLCKLPDGSVVTFGEAGSRAWHDAPPEEQERRKDAGREGGILGAEGGVVGGLAAAEAATEEEVYEMRAAGTEAWEVASEQEKEARKQSGREAGREAWDQSTQEERDYIRTCGTDYWENATQEEREFIVTSGRQAWENLSEDELERAVAGQRKGMYASGQVRHERAEQRYSGAGPPPPITPQLDIWKCKGFIGDDVNNVCQFNCTNSLTVLSFIGVTDLEIQKWIISHNLMDTDCNRKDSQGNDCEGTCYSVALGNKVGLKCDRCHSISKGGCRGLWRMGRLGFTKMFAIIYAIVKGLSYQALVSHIGIKVNKNTFTRYIRDVGLVVGEALERNRRTFGCRFENAQADEVSFGGRKYERVRRLKSSFISCEASLTGS